MEEEKVGIIVLSYIHIKEDHLLAHNLELCVSVFILNAFYIDLGHVILLRCVGAQLFEKLFFFHFFLWVCFHHVWKV